MRLISVLIIFLFLISCSKEISTVEIIEKKEIDLQMIDAYREGLEELELGDGLNAAKKFTEAELLFPQSLWAPRSALMAAYSYYVDNYYADSIYEIERYLKTYPNHERNDYAYYLLGIVYYDQIVDERKDIKAILESKKYFELVIKNYPNTDYALDSKFKIDLINEILASKEIYLARYYIEREKWIPAINRFKNVVNDYGTTIYIEEALYRLVEVYYLLGLKDESKKYASLLGYNYESSQWYENSYALFDKKYEINKQKKNKGKNKNIIQKIRSIMNFNE